jgi:pyruvate/2-oxoglutarate dehydrogenase complex dihydrolipoamide dehydrogenase (E3) component
VGAVDDDMRWTRPRSFEYNLVVIGAGSAGLVSAYVAAAAKARVAIIESDRLGGDCLNTGCVPSKALIHSAKVLKEAGESQRLGLRGQLTADFPEVMARVQQVITRVAPHDSAERYRGLGVDVLSGRARIVDPWTVEVGDCKLVSRSIIVATGAEPMMPPIPGLEQVDPLTSETVWSLTELPGTFLIVGGGGVGCELAQSFARLGSRTIVLETAPRLVMREDAEVSDAVRDALVADGVEIKTGIAIERFEREKGQCLARLADGSSIFFNKVLIATGRRPRTRGFGLEQLGLLDDERLVVDRKLRTRLPNILAAGDVLGELQFTHAASHYAWFAAVNALFGGLKRWNADFRVFPSVIYTDPEVARVGLTEQDAKKQNIAYEVVRFDLAELDRAITDGANDGFIKVLTVPRKDRILGAVIVGARAGDMLAEFTLAMKHDLGLRAVLQTIHPYPGWTEANKAVAGEWQKAHTPAWALALSKRWLQWLRS